MRRPRKTKAARRTDAIILAAAAAAAACAAATSVAAALPTANQMHTFVKVHSMWTSLKTHFGGIRAQIRHERHVGLLLGSLSHPGKRRVLRRRVLLIVDDQPVNHAVLLAFARDAERERGAPHGHHDTEGIEVVQRRSAKGALDYLAQHNAALCAEGAHLRIMASNVQSGDKGASFADAIVALVSRLRHREPASALESQVHPALGKLPARQARHTAPLLVWTHKTEHVNGVRAALLGHPGALVGAAATMDKQRMYQYAYFREVAGLCKAIPKYRYLSQEEWVESRRSKAERADAKRAREEQQDIRESHAKFEAFLGELRHDRGAGIGAAAGAAAGVGRPPVDSATWLSNAQQELDDERQRELDDARRASMDAMRPLLRAARWSSPTRCAVARPPPLPPPPATRAPHRRSPCTRQPAH